MALGTGVHNLSLVVRATNRSRRVFQQVDRDLTKLDRTRQAVGKGFGQLGTAGIVGLKALSAGVGLAIGGSILAFSLFDSKMTQSLAIADNVSEEMRVKLQNAAREIGKTTVFSANEAAEAYFHLFSAGQTASQAIESLPVVAQFAQAGLFDLQEATELLVTSQNALGLAFEDPVKNMAQMTRVADVLAAADENAVGSIEDFANALTNRAAAAMRTYGIEVEEGVAVLAAWATQGLKGKTAGEAFAIVTRDLQKAALKEADAWRERNVAVFDSQGNMRKMADIVGDLEGAMEGLTDAQKKQLLTDLGFQERSQQRLLQLLGTSEAIREFEKDFRQAGGTVEEVSNKQLQTATKQLELLWHAIQDIFIGAGSEFDKGFVNAVKRLKDFVIAIGPEAQEAARTFAEWVGEVTAKLDLLWSHFKLVRDGQDQLNQFFYGKFGPAAAFVIEKIDQIIRAWSDLSDPIREAVKDWGKLIPFIVLAAGVLKVVGIIFGIMAGPGAILALVISGLIIGFKYLWENSEQFRDGLQRLADIFMTRVVPFLREGWALIQEKAREFLAWFESDALPFLEQVWEKIQIAAQIFLEWFNTEALPFLKDLWTQIQETFSAAWEFIVDLFETVTMVVTTIWETWNDEILRILDTAWEIIKGVIMGAWQIVEGIFKIFSAVLTGEWDKFWSGLYDILQGLWSIIWGFIQGVWNNFPNFVTGLLELVGIEWDDFWDGLVGRAAGLWANFVGWWNGVKDAFTGGWTTVWETLSGIVGNTFNALVGLIKPPLNSVLSFIENAVNFAIDGLNNLIGIANNLPGVDIGAVGHISIPRLEDGGRILKQGLALIGENGPELMHMARGAVVEPLPPRVRDGGVVEETIIFQGTPQQMLADWRRESKLRLATL